MLKMSIASKKLQKHFKICIETLTLPLTVGQDYDGTKTEAWKSEQTYFLSNG